MADNSAATLSRHSLPKISFCGQRQRLLGAFCEAIEQLTMLLDHDVAAVISGYLPGRKNLPQQEQASDHDGSWKRVWIC